MAQLAILTAREAGQGGGQMGRVQGLVVANTDKCFELPFVVVGSAMLVAVTVRSDPIPG